MLNFKYNEQTSLPTPIEFTAKIDEDGDFVVSANGVDLFYIDAESGQVNRFFDKGIAGLGFQTDGTDRITVDSLHGK